jgi:hypothetical protein
VWPRLRASTTSAFIRWLLPTPLLARANRASFIRHEAPDVTTKPGALTNC